MHMKKHGLSHGDVSLENVMLYDPTTTSSSSSSTSSKNKRRKSAAAGAAEVQKKEEGKEEGRPLANLHCRLIDLEMARYTPSYHSPSSTSSLPSSPGPSGGKPSYAAPECVYNNTHGPSSSFFDPHAADVWSLGVCLYMLLTGRPLYRGPTDEAFHLLALNGAPGLLSYYSQEYGLVLPPSLPNLLCRMLCADVKERITLEELMGVEWIQAGGRQAEEEEGGKQEGEEGESECWSPTTTVGDETSVLCTGGGGREEEEEEEEEEEGERRKGKYGKEDHEPLLELLPPATSVAGLVEEKERERGEERKMKSLSPVRASLMLAQ